MLSPSESGNVLDELSERLAVYSNALKSAQQEGNASKERRYKRIIKQYADSIKLIKNGKTVAFDELPNPPGFGPIGGPRTPTVTPSSPVACRPTRVAPAVPDLLLPDEDIVVNVSSGIAESDNTEKEDEEIGSPEIPIVVTYVSDNPDNIAGELQLRLRVYEEVQKSAADEGNASKARRYKRIITQYNTAISHVKSGKQITLEELPNPPGFSPLVPPKSSPPSPQPSPIAPRKSPQPSPSSSRKLQPSPVSPEKRTQSSPIPQKKPLLSPDQPHTKVVVTRAEKQTLILRERQQEYKEAALNAKKLGQLNEAKEFLRMYKGFDKLISASEGGHPVDLTSIPVSLKTKRVLDDDFCIVNESDCSDIPNSELFQKLESELMDQIKRCDVYKTSFRKDGDIANANRFELLSMNFKKDLTFVKAASQRGDPIPKFHYETMSFSVTRCNSDLTDNDLELNIIQGIDYNVNNPEEVDTYIKYEYPFPNEASPKGYTKTVKNTNNPKYDETIKFPIQRDSKAFQRIFKRQSSYIKLEVMSKGGFFKSDVLLGTVNIKVLTLASEPTIHEAFDLMNGRKATGGKLEVKVRIRHPLFTKKLEQVSEKWVMLN